MRVRQGSVRSVLTVTGDADYGMFFLGQIPECCVDKLNWMRSLALQPLLCRSAGLVAVACRLLVLVG